jgi:hypothetical protein
MPAALALGPVHAAVLAKLKADAGLIAAVPAARITDQPPQTTTGTVYPYVLVEGGDETRFNTMGHRDLPKWGGVVTVRVRVVSQYRGDAEAMSVLSLVRAALDDQPLAVTGFPTALVAFENAVMLKDAINNIVTRELVGQFTVTAHQS